MSGDDRDVTASLARETAALADAAAPARVLVVGSTPPGGRDLDLLVRRGHERAIAEALRAAGARPRGRTWARFADCTAYAVELIPAASWGLPAAELEALYGEASTLPGFERLAEPAPHHRLLILARMVGRGRMSDARRARVERALAEAPEAWRRAAEHAGAWRARPGLARLRAAVEGRPGSRLSRLGRAARGARRPRVVALSGIDGSGKSTQALRLQIALDRLGHPAEVIWTPLGSNPWLGLVARPVKRALAGRLAAPAAGAAAAAAAPSNPGPAIRERRPAVGAAWTAIVALANAMSQAAAAVRHAPAGRVVIFDRYVLDSVVRMRVQYGRAGRPLVVPEALVRALSPRPVCAFFLDIPPETSLARKDDRWTLAELEAHARVYRREHARFGARRLDGERPAGELCAEIAEEVWRRLA